MIKQTYKLGFEILMIHLRTTTNDKFGTILKMALVNLDDSGFLTGYVSQLGDSYRSFFNVVKNILSENFCFHILNSLPKIVTDSFFGVFYKVKRVDDSGAEKLLMDICELKTIILNLYKLVSNRSVEGDFNYNW